MDVIKLVKTRRSIRRFKPAKVPREVITAILDLAKWAPSAHNAQPWRIIVIDDEAVKARLATAMGKAWLKDMLKNGVSKSKAEEIVRAESWERITKSPVVIIACLSMEGMHVYPDGRRRKAEYLMAIQSVAAYIQNALLLAHYYGLGACWVCAPLFCQTAVRKALGLPREIEPQAMIIMGYPDEEPKPPPRKPIETFLMFNSWVQR